MKTAYFEAFAEIVDSENEDSGGNKNPLLTLAKFIFTDDKPNNNKQGIKATEFDDIIRTAIGTPVKMRFFATSSHKGTAAGHSGSVPIGHISAITKVEEEGINKLAAEAILYKNEFPEEVGYLKNAYAGGHAPGISYELQYSDYDQENGIQWIKDITTMGATFVRNPAYGNRTALIALASDKELDDKQFASALSELASEWNNEESKGGKKMTDEEIKALQDQFAAALAENTELKTKLEEKDATITENGQALALAEDKNKELTEQIETSTKNEIRATRTARMVEAGFADTTDAEKLAKKQEYWLSFAEDAFDQYVTDLIEASKKKVEVALASDKATTRVTLVPRPVVEEGKGMAFAELKQTFGTFARPGNQ
jgi:hypothetical protein